MTTSLPFTKLCVFSVAVLAAQLFERNGSENTNTSERQVWILHTRMCCCTYHSIWLLFLSGHFLFVYPLTLKCFLFFLPLHMHFKDYSADKNQKWQGKALLQSNAPWTKLPRGDQGGKIKKTVHDAAHATKAVIMHELIIEAIDGAFPRLPPYTRTIGLNLFPFLTFLISGKGAMALYAQEAASSREQAKRLERIKATAAQRRQEKAAEIEARHRREIAEMRAQEAARELHNSDEDSSEDEWSGGVSWGAPTFAKSPSVIASGPLKSALKTQVFASPLSIDILLHFYRIGRFLEHM